MNRQETGAIMDILKAAYPRLYADQKELRGALNLWHDMFADDDVRIVAAAVKRLIATDTKGFPPPIGAVKEQIWRIQNSDQITEQEAWQMVAKAVNTSNAERSFNELPPEVRQIVGSPVQLTEWGRMDETAFQSVVASNFQRSFRARKEVEKERAKLPQDVRRLEQIATRALLMEALEGKDDA